MEQRTENEIKKIARMEQALMTDLSPSKKMELIKEIHESQIRVEILRRAK